MIDIVEFEVVAGNGGDGAVSFRREKFVPHGGPDGGDGGDGGDVILIADRQYSTLQQYHDGRPQAAARGEPGSGNRSRGASGSNLVVRVPKGSEIVEVLPDGEGVLIADLADDGASTIVARGGRGGRGNKRFTTPTRQAPRFAQGGVEGERRQLRIELKLLADVGLIGLPNAGKSTLLRAWSAAQPKVASYPFTTLEPELGVVNVGYDNFVAADMPGLIEGASQGVGLGHEFLRHIERTRVLVHVLDMSRDDPVADRELIDAELAAFGHGLAEKPQLIAMNKVDVPDARAHIELLEESDAIEELGEPRFAVSAATRESTDDLARRTLQVLREAIDAELAGRPPPVLHPPPRRARFVVRRTDDGVVVEGRSPERWAQTLPLHEEEARQELLFRLRRMGVSKALVREGVTPGEIVRIGTAQVRWE
jgi:GTP-binding protein